MLKLLIGLTVLVLALVSHGYYVSAWDDGHGNFYVCHCTEDSCQTLTLPFEEALNHMEDHPNDYEDRCIQESPTPTPTIEITPTITPTIEVTPTVEITPTATPTLIVEPTVSPTVEIKPAVTTEVTIAPNAPSSSTSGSSNAHISNPSCDTPKPDKIAWSSVDSGVIGDGKFTINWTIPAGAKRINIEYSEVKGQPQHGVVTDNDGHEEVGGLKQVHYWYRLQAQDECATSDWSEWYDPMP